MLFKQKTRRKTILHYIPFHITVHYCWYTWLCSPLSVTFINCKTRAESSASSTSCDSTLHEIHSKYIGNCKYICMLFQSQIAKYIDIYIWQEKRKTELPTASRLFNFKNSSNDMNNPRKFCLNNSKFIVISSL
jgi:hypothetical protein